MVKQELLEKCQTVWIRHTKKEKKSSHLLFSPSVRFKVDQKDTRIKSSSEKVQVRGKLSEIVSMSPTGFMRFECGTRLAGTGMREILLNYSQRDVQETEEKKSTSIKLCLYFFLIIIPVTCAHFNKLPICLTPWLILLRAIYQCAWYKWMY